MCPSPCYVSRSRLFEDETTRISGLHQGSARRELRTGLGKEKVRKHKRGKHNMVSDVLGGWSQSGDAHPMGWHVAWTRAGERRERRETYGGVRGP